MPSDSEKAHRDLLWGMYVDLRTHARHAETLRANAVALVVVMSSALVALIAADRVLDEADSPLAVLILALGAIGLAFSASYTELFERNRTRAITLRDAIDDDLGGSGRTTVRHLLENSDREHNKRLIRRFGRGRVGSAKVFWMMVPALVSVLGLVLLVAAQR